MVDDDMHVMHQMIQRLEGFVQLNVAAPVGSVLLYLARKQ